MKHGFFPRLSPRPAPRSRFPRFPRSALLVLIAGPSLALASPPAASTTPADVERRLLRLENELSTLRAENDQLRRELGLAADAPATGGATDSAPSITVRPAGRETSLALGGLIQVQADALDRGDARFASENDRFYLRRARINASGLFAEDFDFRVELELAGSLGEGSSTRGQLTDAYLTWLRHDLARVRLGQFKSPYGFEQLASDPKLFTIERSLAKDRLTLGRQSGVQLAGDLFDEQRLA